MTALQRLWDTAWPFLVLLTMLIALRRQPPAGLRLRLMGGVLVGLVGVRLLGEEMGFGPIGDPRDAYALLACLGLGIVAVSKLLHLPDPS